MEPITTDWLDACGIRSSTRGSVTIIYQADMVGLRFVEGKLRNVEFRGCACDVKTRQDLRDLLRLTFQESLSEPASAKE